MEGLESHFEVARLVVRFLEGEITEAEQAKLDLWINESEEHQMLWEQWTDPEYVEAHLEYWKHQDLKGRWKELSQKIDDTKVRRFGYRKLFKYAAVFVGIVMLGLSIFYFSQTNHDALLATENSETSIMPLGNVAQLELGDGNVIDLIENKGRTITEKDGTKVHNGGDILSYQAPESKSGDVVYNTLRVPAGGEYKVTLSDGTKVWLNAASSLRYPTHFGNSERKVILTGEAYFEVTHDASRPFKVTTESADVKVLGTKFNVRSYGDDSRDKVSLAEGSVLVEKEVHGNKKQVLLRPGYGVVIEKKSGAIQSDKINLDAELAWKDDMFVFDNETLSSIMKRLSRWYNVDVTYDRGVDTTLHFTGRIQKFEDIAGVFRLIGMTNKVEFKVQRRKVTVTPHKDDNSVETR